LLGRGHFFLHFTQHSNEVFFDPKTIDNQMIPFIHVIHLLGILEPNLQKFVLNSVFKDRNRPQNPENTLFSDPCLQRQIRSFMLVLFEIQFSLRGKEPSNFSACNHVVIQILIINFPFIFDHLQIIAFPQLFFIPFSYTIDEIAIGSRGILE
jgi:hypothetical protein